MLSENSFLPTRIVPRISFKTRGLILDSLPKTQAEGNEADKKESIKFFTGKRFIPRVIFNLKFIKDSSTDL